MKKFGNFKKNILSKSEMKSLNGGTADCHVWNISSNGTYTVASAALTKREAQICAAGLVADFGAGYGWCCGNGC